MYKQIITDNNADVFPVFFVVEIRIFVQNEFKIVSCEEKNFTSLRACESYL